MNTNHDDRFDAALRGHHEASLERVSPRVRAQLAQRRNAALRGESVRRAYGIRYAVGGFAALCALAIGLQFGTAPAPVPGPPATGSVASATANAATMLDEDPEFYAWLASDDARLVALE